MTVGKVKDFNFSSGGMAKGYAMGGKAMEPSRKAMVKRESMETPRMQRKEVMQRETVKAPAAPQGMLRNRGALGVIANKNPGETRMNTAPNLPGEKMMMNKGGMAMSKGGMHMMPDGKMMKNSAMKKGGMAEGGMPMVMKDGKKVPAFAADGEGKMKHGGTAKKMNMGGIAKGGMKNC